MNGARYLVRFDDICPTMDWSIWEKVESLLLKLEIKPILAVVPDNKDPKLDVMPPRKGFWDRVRFWQSQGWCIALHGFEHRYETAATGLVGINAKSEFAGLARQIQKRKLESAMKIFSARGVTADAWIAPGHSFDETTIELITQLGIQIISDGFYWRPVHYLGAIWVPQQMWRFRPLPGGIWTVCYHSNQFSEVDLTRLNADLHHYRHRIIGLSDVLAKRKPNPITNLDHLFNWCWMNAIQFKRRWLK